VWLIIFGVQFRFFLNQYNHEVNFAIDEITRDLDDKNERFGDMLKYSQAFFESHIASKEEIQNIKNKLKKNEKEKIIELYSTIEEGYGALTMDENSVPDNEKFVEISKAISLTPIFKKVLSFYPKSPWVYYLSNDFIYIYPYVNSHEYKFSKKETLSMEFYKNNLPENNYSRALTWTNPYYDQAGKGMLITASLPVYVKNKFYGSVSIDVKLDEISSGIDLSSFKSGDLFIVSKKGSLIASNDINISSLKEPKNIFETNLLEKWMKNGANNFLGKKVYISFSKVLNCYVVYQLPYRTFLLNIFSKEVLSYLFLALLILLNAWFYLSQKIQSQLEGDIIYKNKLISLAEMSGGIAHEINNPLTVIRVRTAQIMKKVDNEKENFDFDNAKSNLEKVLFSVDRISSIIKSLRNFSKDEKQNEFTIVKIKSIVDEAILLCENRIKNADSKLILDEVPEAEIRCHSFQIVQILINLINNSFDAVDLLEEKWIHISFEVQGTKLLVFITDSGNGIKKEIAKKMFDPFFSTKGHSYGTGLGLSISKKIALLHQGDLYIDQKNANTRFVLELPLSGHS
jgi:signal transduction histidine kinase